MTAPVAMRWCSRGAASPEESAREDTIGGVYSVGHFRERVEYRMGWTRRAPDFSRLLCEAGTAEWVRWTRPGAQPVPFTALPPDYFATEETAP